MSQVGKRSSWKLRVRGGVAGTSAVATLALVAACGGGTGPSEGQNVEPAPSDEQVTLTMWFGRENFIPDDAFDAFHTEHPNIRVETDVIPLEQAPADYIRQFDANDAPDLFQVEFDEASLLARRGMLMDVSEVIATWKEEDPALYGNMADIAWDMASWDGTPYGMALHYGPYFYIYRTDLLAEVGAEVPTTWEEVLEVGRAIVADTDSYGYGTNGSREEKPMWDIGVFAQMGGQWEDGVMQIDSPAGHYWLEFYQTLMRDGIADPDVIAWNAGDVRASFISGTIAQATEGINVFPEFQTAIEYGPDWGASASPIAREGAEDEARYVAGGWPYYMSSQTEHPYEAGLVLRYLAGFDQALSVALRYQPVSNLEVMGSDEYREAHPYAGDLLGTWESVVQRPSHLNQSAMLEVVRDAVQWALQNPDADAAEAAQSFQEELDELAAEVAE